MTDPLEGWRHMVALVGGWGHMTAPVKGCGLMVASTSRRWCKYTEDVGYEWWTDWLVEVEEEELLEISCQDLKETDGKEVKILWERSVGERTIL